MLLPLFIVSLLEARYPFNSHILWHSSARHFGTQYLSSEGCYVKHHSMYSVVRHPLYVGNYLIALGLSCFPRVWYLPIIASLANLLFYERIAFWDEEFRVWAAQVPAMIPTLRHYRPPPLPFSWGRALGREFYALSIVTTSFFLMDVIQEFVITGRIALDPVWTPVFLFGAVFFAVMRVLKKRTDLLKR